VSEPRGKLVAELREGLLGEVALLVGGQKQAAAVAVVYEHLRALWEDRRQIAQEAGLAAPASRVDAQRLRLGRCQFLPELIDDAATHVRVRRLDLRRRREQHALAAGTQPDAQRLARHCGLIAALEEHQRGHAPLQQGGIVARIGVGHAGQPLDQLAFHGQAGGRRERRQIPGLEKDHQLLGSQSEPGSELT